MQIIATAPDGKSYPVKVKEGTTPAQAEKLGATLMSVGARAVVIRY